MRHLLVFIFALFLSFTVSCSKDEVEGPQGPQGIEGEQGPKGDQGDPGANAQKFTVSVSADEWSGGHFGDNNLMNRYEVPESAIGDHSLSDPDYVILAYARPSGPDYSERRPVPHSYVVNDNRITLDIIPSRNLLIMHQSDNGVDVKSLPLDQRPEEVRFTIFLIEVSAAQQLEGKIDFSDYEQVSSHFDL